MDSWSETRSPQPTWLTELNTSQTVSFFDSLANTPPEISHAGMQSMPYAHPSPFSTLPIRSVEASPAPGASPYSWSALLVTGTPFMSPRNLNASSSRASTVVPADSPRHIDGSTDERHDAPSEPSSPDPEALEQPHTQPGPPDLERHRSKIKRLYIDDNLPLKETMRILKDEDGLGASRKQYTAKIKEWGLVKNIPSSKADWMLRKAEKRKEQSRKDTTFQFGDREWNVDRIQRSGKRTKTPRAQEILDDMSTPTDIAYSTPHDSQTTLRSTLSPDPPMIQAAAWTSSPSKLPTVHYLRLVWNGHTRSDIENIYREAQLLERTGKPEDAELKLREALTGLENLLTPTHDETNKVGYHLADFYARNNRMKDADIVLSRMIDAHMGQWGIEHKKTITHLVHIADLFQSWSRTDDAITLLSRAAEAHQKLLKHAVPSSSESGQTVEQFSYPQHSTEGSTHFASRPTHAPTFNSQEHDRNQVEYQISVAKAQMAAKDTGDDNIEDLLLGLVEQCEKHPEGLAIQIFDARQALVELYQKSDNSGKVSKTLIDAENAFWAIMKSGAKKTAVLLQAAIDITALHVRHKRYEPANLMFEEIQAKMVEIFGIDDHVTISLLISIGIVYQRQKRWSDAQPRFEQALAASMTANSLESNITRGLEEALEEQCYLMSNPQSQGLTSTTAKRGSHCLGHEFGCHDTRSVLNSFVSSENGR